MSTIRIEELQEKPNDDRIYLLNKPAEGCYFFAWNEKLIFAVKTEPRKFIKRSTALLEFNQSVQLSGVDKGEPLQCDFIIMKSIPSQQSVDTFVRLCSTFSNHGTESLESFFGTLVALFSKSREKETHVIGLFGELAMAKFFLEHFNANFESFWQKDGNTSKYDFTLPTFNIEVKSSVGSPFLAKIKHDQIFNNDDVVLATCCIENNSSGSTILEIIDELKTKFKAFRELRTSVLLEERLLRIPTDEQSIHFATKEIKFFQTKEINQFPVLPERVKGLNYTLDMTGLPVVDPQTLVP